MTISKHKPKDIDWRTIIRRIKSGKCTPIISYQVSSHHFSRYDQVVAAWANEVNYPLPNRSNLTEVAQYASVTSRDNLAAKEGFLDFLKQYLLNQARAQQSTAPSDFLDTLADELFDLTFSEVATRLGYPQYDDELQNPLRILAELPLPIYLTSNYCTFMENALQAAGKEPRTEICYWCDSLADDVPSVFELDPDYQPSIEQPLVYHIHGLDRCPSSLVLTEDDYLDFLVRVSQDMAAVPNRVAQALADSSLLMLGYQLSSWDFKVIFRGLITAKRASRRLLSLSIQLLQDTQQLDEAETRAYLHRYFESANFDIYWGDAQNFTQELWQQWQS